MRDMGVLRITLVLLAVALTAASCGRRGPLEPPPGKVTDGQVSGDTIKGDGDGDENPNDRPFILDPLI